MKYCEIWPVLSTFHVACVTWVNEFWIGPHNFQNGPSLKRNHRNHWVLWEIDFGNPPPHFSRIDLLIVKVSLELKDILRKCRVATLWWNGKCRVAGATFIWTGAPCINICEYKYKGNNIRYMKMIGMGIWECFTFTNAHLHYTLKNNL